MFIKSMSIEFDVQARQRNFLNIYKRLKSFFLQPLEWECNDPFFNKFPFLGSKHNFYFHNLLLIDN